MPTPPKPFSVLSSEKKSHRTKAELKMREQGEKALASGVALSERTEVRGNKIAHEEFVRIESLLRGIQKNDAIYESVINRYCMIYAECREFEEKREQFYEDMKSLENGEMSDAEYFKLKVDMQKQIISLDKQVQAKRKMLLDIEKENIMTIASALRVIPKTPEKSSNKLLEILNGGG